MSRYIFGQLKSFECKQIRVTEYGQIHTQVLEHYLADAQRTTEEFLRQERNEQQQDRKRKIEDICLEKICAAVIYVLKAQISLPQSDLILAVARIFGYSRVSAVEERVMMAARSAQEKGLAVIKDGMVMIIS